MRIRVAVAFEAQKLVEIVEPDLECPDVGEVLVEIMATGICHTDAYTLDGLGFEVIFPSVRGHKDAGVVREIDPMITHTLTLEEINKGHDLMHACRQRHPQRGGVLTMTLGAILDRHKTCAGALLPILNDVQAAFDFVGNDAIRTIAAALNLSRAEACQARGVEALIDAAA